MQSAALGVYLMIAGAGLVLIVSGWVAFEGWPGQRAAETVDAVRVGQSAPRSADEPVQRVVVGSRAKAVASRSSKRSSNSRAVQALSAAATPSRLQRASRRKPARRRSSSPSQTTPAPAASAPAATAEPTATAAPDPVSGVVDEALETVEGIINPLVPVPSP